MRVWRYIGLPFLAAAIGAAGFAFVLADEIGTYRRAILTWAERDMRARAEIAAEALGTAPVTGDVRRLHAFGRECEGNGVRLTVLTAPGGLLFDTHRDARGTHADRPEVKAAMERGEGWALRRSATAGGEMLYAARRAEGFLVRLGIPAETVFAPAEGAKRGLMLAGLAGASGILAVFAFLWRLSRRNLELARERDDKVRKLEELERAEEFRRTFVSNVTHEIKTPLTGILGAVDLLTCGEELGDGEREELLGMVKKESLRLDALAKDILELARLEHEERTAAETGEIDLVAAAEEAAGRVRHKAKAAGVELEVRAGAGVAVNGDAGLAERAITNLLENALKHSGAKRIRLEVRAGAGGGAEAEVADDGCGLTAEQCGRVFERFWRADKSRSREAGGTGLGLSIVKHAMRLQGGTVRVESEPGKGSRFILAFSSVRAEAGNKNKKEQPEKKGS